MKRIKLSIAILLAAVLLLSSAGCGLSGSSGENGERLETISQDEYILYQNIFYKKKASQFDGKTVTKNGVFAVLHDAYNDVDRYYVWGYYDGTKCCDWQWEFKPKQGEELPAVGSLVTVSGTFSYDEDALDKYRIIDATVRTKTVYTGKVYDLNMYVMSDTLERVQIINVIRFPDYFEGRDFIAYGRIKSLTVLQDPYYNESWEIGFTLDGSVPAIGATVVLAGTVHNGQLNAKSIDTLN